MSDPYAAHRKAAKAIAERRIRREHKLAHIADAIGPTMAQVISAATALAPGPMGMALRAVLHVVGKQEQLSESRVMRAKILSLTKAVEAIGEISREAFEDSLDPLAADGPQSREIVSGLNIEPR